MPALPKEGEVRETMGTALFFIVMLLIIVVPFFVISLVERGVKFRWPWQHADDCPCGPCIDKAVAREVGHLERKRRIAEVRKALEELERERRGRP